MAKWAIDQSHTNIGFSVKHMMVSKVKGQFDSYVANIEAADLTDLSTAQLDFLLPQRFDLSYIGEDGQPQRPVVIHRGVVSTMERFVAFLIEEYKGAFPTWLAPVQATIIPVSNSVHYDYAREVQEKLAAAGVRVEMDDREEKLGYKIREAQMQKIPYMLVIGDKEVEAGGVNIRRYGSKDSETIAFDEFLATITAEATK